MANIPIRDIPGAVVASPDPSNLIPMDNGSIMQKTTIENAVNTTLPLSSQAEAEAGGDNVKRMSPLRTKQAIDAQTPLIVNTAITALNLGTMSQEESSDYTPTSGLAAVALSNDYNDLDNLPTLGTAAATDASDYATAAQGTLASTAVQPGNAALVPSGGTIGQVLVKNSGTNYDTGWVSSAAATAVSYAPQTLTDAQAGQARANIDAGVLAGFRNKIINGDFSISQRGAGPFSANTVGGTFGPDRWVAYKHNGGDTLSFARQNLGAQEVAAGYADSPNALYVSAVGSGGDKQLWQSVEGVWTLNGKLATLAFWAYNGSSSPVTISPLVQQGFGVGGSATVRTDFTPQILPPTSWTNFSKVVQIPSIAGKIIGEASFLNVFLLNDNFEGTILFSKVSLVEGDATAETDPFSPRHIQQELALCQRYYQRYDEKFTLSSGGEANINKHLLPVPMYSSPTIVQVTPNGTGATWIASAVNVQQSGIHSVDASTELLTLEAEIGQ